jgi:hypothetical protein
MIDKCRAVLAGTQGEYIYPCPLDERLLEFAAISSADFTEAVKAHPEDRGVVEWFIHAAAPHSAAERDAWNEALLRRRPSTPESAERFKQYRDAIDPSRTDLTAWADLQDLEEGRPVPRREPVARPE